MKRNRDSRPLSYELLEAKKLLAGLSFNVPNLVQNGNFDSFPNYQGQRLVSSAELGGWLNPNDLTARVLDIRPNMHEETGFLINLDSSSNRLDSIFQDLPTELGQDYLLTFDFLGHEDGYSPQTNDFSVIWNGEEVGRFSGERIWQSGGIKLKNANHGSTRLEFAEISEADFPNGDGLGPFIDSIFAQPWDEVPLVNEGFETKGLQRWKANGGQSDPTDHQLRADWASQGKHVLQVDVNPDQIDRLSRSFKLRPHQKYLLSFDLRGSEFTEGQDSNQLRVRWNGEWVSTFIGGDNWNRHYVEVTADENGHGELVLREPSGIATDGQGPYVDNLQIELVSHTVQQQLASNATITSFNIAEIGGNGDLTVSQDRTIELTWTATGAYRYGLELWDLSGPIDTASLIVGGSRYGNIHADFPYIFHEGSESSEQRSRFTIPRNLDAGDYRIKLVAWDSQTKPEAVGMFRAFEVREFPKISAFIFDKTLAPSQDEIVVTWRISHEVVQEHGATGLKLVFDDPNDVIENIRGSAGDSISLESSNFFTNLNTNLVYDGDQDWFEQEISLESGGTLTDVKGFTIIELERDRQNLFLSGDYTFDIKLVDDGFFSNNEITTVNEERAHEDVEPLTLNITEDWRLYAGDSSDLNLLYASKQLSGAEQKAQQLLNITGETSNGVARFVADAIKRRQLENQSAFLNNQSFNIGQQVPEIINDAFEGNVIVHSWRPNRPTLIAIHGIRTGASSHFALGEELMNASDGSYNIISFRWGWVGAISGLYRDVGGVLASSFDASLDFEAKRMVRGAVDLNSLIEIVNGLGSSDVSLMAHSQGTVVTTMALGLFASNNLPVRSTLFIGANISRHAAEVGGPIAQLAARFGSELRIENLYSDYDNVVDYGPGEGAGEKGFTGAVNYEVIPGILYSHDTVATAIRNINGQFTKINHVRQNGGVLGPNRKIGWWDWVAAKEAESNFVKQALGVGGQSGDFISVMQDFARDIPIIESGSSSGSSSSSSYNQSPEIERIDLSDETNGLTSGTGPITVNRGELVIVEAFNAFDPDGGPISYAAFFWDQNGDGFAQSEEILGYDRNPGNGWKTAVYTSSLPLGEIEILGIVIDDEGTSSEAKGNYFFLRESNGPPAELPPVLPSHREVDFQIVPHRNGDIYYAGPDYVLQDGKIDYWAIAPRTARTFNFETYGSTDTALGIYDYDSGELLAFDEDNGTGENAELQYPLDSETTYIVAVVSQDGSEGNYEFEVRSGTQAYTDSFDVQPPTYEETLSDSITTPFGFDFFKVDAPATATSISVRLTPEEMLDGWVRIEDENHVTIATSYLAGTGQQDQIIDVPVNGGETYRIAVSSVQETTGTYDLEVDFNPDESGLPNEVDPWPNAVPLIPFHGGDQLLEGLSIDNPNEFDFYYVTTTNSTGASGTKPYTFETRGDLDTQLGVYQFYNEFGSTLIVGDDDSGAGKNASVTLDLENGQQYVVLVRSDNNETGTYDLVMQRPPEDTVDEIIISGLESKGSDSISVGSTTTRYQIFSTVAPDNATELDILADLATANAEADVALRVHTADGELVGWVDNAGVGGNEEILNLPVIGGEEYFVTVNNLNFEHDLASRIYFDFNPDFQPQAGTEFVVNTTTFGRQEWPAVARNSSGLTVTAWEGERSQSEFQNDIFFQLLDIDNQPITPEVRIQSASDSLYQFQPFAAMNEQGQFVVGWRDENSDRQFQRFNANGTAIGSITTVGIEASAVTIRDDGLLFFAGRDRSFEGTTNEDPVMGRIFNSNNTPRTAPFFIDLTADQKSDLNIEIAQDGDFIVGWTAYADARNREFNTSQNLVLFAVYDDAGNPIDFGERDYRAGEIHGVWYIDGNQNGGFDQGENVIPNKDVYVDFNGDGFHNASEPVTTTDSEGKYLFESIGPGFFSIAAVDGSAGGAFAKQDAFNRTNSSDLGPDWLEVDGDFEIENGQLRSPQSDRSYAVYQPHDSGQSIGQTVTADVHYDQTITYQNGLFEISFGYENEFNGLSFYVFASPTNGPNEFSRIRFFDRRNVFGEWQRMIGGEEYSDIPAFSSARITASLDRASRTLRVGFDTNFDGIDDFFEIRGGIEVEDLGTKVAVGGNGLVAIDNFKVDGNTRSVPEQVAVSGFEKAWGLVPGQFPKQQDLDFDVAPDGNIFAVFSHRNLTTNTSTVYATQLDSNFESVFAPIQVNTTAVNSQWDAQPAIAAFEQDRFMAVWHNNDDGVDSVGIAGQRFGPGGAKIGPEFQVNQHIPGIQKWTDLASNGIDSAFVAWTGGGEGFGVDDQDGSVEGIIGREIDFGAISESELEVQDSSGTANDRYVDFNTRPLGSSISSRTVTIINEGNADLSVFDLELVGDDESVFGLTGPANFVLAPGATQAFNVTFDPRIEGEFFASIRFSHDDDADTLSGDFDSSPHWISLHAAAEGDPRLELNAIPGVFREDAGTFAGTLVVTRVNGDHSEALVVTLVSGDTSEVQVPLNVTIPAGVSSVSVPLEAIDDFDDDGSQFVSIFATASGHQVGFASVEVLSVNHAPVLDNIPSQSLNVGESLNFIANASDPDNPADTLTFSIVSGPSGATIDSQTGEVNWMPSQSGEYQLIIRVSDDGSPVLSAEQVVSISVSPAVQQIDVASFNVLRGNLLNGGLPTLQASDNQRLGVARNSSALQSMVEIEFSGISNVTNPNALSFTIENSVFTRRAVSQTILMYNFETEEYEEIDTRLAARFTDATTTVDLTGDLARFIDVETGELKTLLRFQGATPRTGFATNIDFVHWNVQ